MKITYIYFKTKSFFLLFVIALATITMLSQNANAGTGTFNNGLLDFCISVRFDATEAELDQIKNVLERGSQTFSDATNGQHRFGTVSIVNRNGCSEAAELWINPDTPGQSAHATYGEYGVRGRHINMYFPSEFSSQAGADGDAYTVAHEFAHHVYGVADEYKNTSDNPAECASSNNSTDDFCLMDNYFTRGSRTNSANYSLNEFCVSSNHDPDGDTVQENFYKESCWAHISSPKQKRRATAPQGLPGGGVFPHNITFNNKGSGLRVMIVIDRSGSMTIDQRINLAKSGANLFIDLLKDGDSVGVASFSNSASLNFSLTTISGAGTRNNAKAAINNLQATGATNIGGGLQVALNQFNAQTEESCNEIILLLSDGDHNTGTTPESVIPALKARGANVISIGVGSGISSGGQAALQNVATQTGGKYFQTNNAADLPGLFARLSAETSQGGTLASKPQPISSGETKNILIPVETGVASVTFAIAYPSQNDQLSLALRSPSGVVISEINASSFPGVEVISGANLRAFRISNPEAGEWTMIVSAGAMTSGFFDAVAFADSEGVDLYASVLDDTLAFPEVVEIQATPTYKGLPVVGATVTGTATRPDGSVVSFTLFDNGLTVNGDIDANDGIYSARFNNYRGDGTYNFQMTAVAANGTTYPGEELFSVFGPLVPNPVPSFTRITTTTAVVTGVPRNAPPDVSQATPSRNVLFPANNSMVWIGINNVTDPDGDPVTIKIDRIMQDEVAEEVYDPVVVSLDPCPDVGLTGGSFAFIRAQRSILGNGRVYTVLFTATDGNGGSSQGFVKVSVPRNATSSAVDDGALYSSMACRH